MKWSDVGEWLKQNSTQGAALVGSLLAGNAPGAVAAGIALVSSATGATDPQKVLTALQQDPATVVRLQELANQEHANIRAHIEAMERLKLEDLQAEHATTQQTIINGDNSSDPVVRRTRPLQSWISLIFAMALAWTGKDNITEIYLYLIGTFLTLPWAYAGLREVGKGINAIAQAIGKRRV